MQNFTVCAYCLGTSPLNLNQRVNVVQVRAFCLVDGKLKQQARKRFKNTM